MKLKTKLLILASAGLLALSMVACGNNGEQEDQTTADTSMTDVTVSTDVEEDDATREPLAEGTTEVEPQENPSVAETETVAEPQPSESEPESGGAAIGPVPPVVTDPETAPVTQPEVTMPPVEGVETNEDGYIELPFVPFD